MIKHPSFVSHLDYLFVQFLSHLSIIEEESAKLSLTLKKIIPIFGSMQWAEYYFLQAFYF